MAVISVTNTVWSSPVTLSVDEIWQVRGGDVLVASWNPSNAQDGWLLSGATNDPIQFKAGAVVRYRLARKFEKAILIRGAR